MKKRYRFMPLSRVLKHEPKMKALGVSKVARSKRGFLTAYKRAGKAGNLSEKWKAKRNGFIERHNAQYKVKRTNRRKLALIAWAYKP